MRMCIAFMRGVISSIDDAADGDHVAGTELDKKISPSSDLNESQMLKMIYFYRSRFTHKSIMQIVILQHTCAFLGTSRARQ